MEYSIRENNFGDKDLIDNFNKELDANGFNFKLPQHNKKLSDKNNFIFEHRFILTENNNIIRAGYNLKYQWFKVNNELIQLGYYYNPVTAGLFNKKYNVCGILLLNDAVKKKTDLFSLGMGGYSEPLPKLLKGMGWDLKKVPFFFKIIHPYIFLKNIRYLRNTKLKLIFIEILTISGLGWLGIKFISLLHYILNFSKKKKELDIIEIKTVDKSFDNLWEEVKDLNSFIAVRNNKYLNELYSSDRFIKLKFSHNNKVVGWSISLCTKLNEHKQFGSMKLGSIVDCLCLKNYEIEIINKTTEALKKKGSNLIVSNQSHISWQNAFKKNIFIRGVSNFIFASSKSLNNKIKNKKFIHITRGDGDGPINL